MKIKIVHDEDPESPRDWDNLGKISCWHQRYSLGDEQPREEPGEWYKENIQKRTVVLPLYLYDHSGITISTSCQSWPFNCCWDAGQVGWIYVTPSTIREEFKKKRISAELQSRVREILDAEVKVYDQYLQGQCWGFVVEDKDGERVDSCWGFFGDTLEETGILEHLTELPIEAVEVAWEKRK